MQESKVELSKDLTYSEVFYDLHMRLKVATNELPGNQASWDAEKKELAI